MENTTTAGTPVPLQELFAKGQYDQFIKLVMEQQDSYSPAQYHMLLGSAYAKNGSLAVGRYHLEKAKHLGYHGVDLTNNLEAVRERLDVRDLAVSRNWSDQLTYYSCQIPSEVYWSFSLLILLGALVVVMKSHFQKITLPIALAILSIVPLTYERTVVSHVHFAVSLQETAVLEGPSKIFADKTKLPAGAKLIIGKSVDSWVFIEAPLIYSGWVDRTLLGLY